jgi:hypothetical protein
MKRFALVALLVAMLFGIASSASATELMVKGNLDVYGMWSANLRDFDSDNGDADNYYTSQRMRTYFTFQTNENLKAVLGLEMNHDWGQGSGAGAGGQWGSDGRDNIRVKHAYLDFVFPDTQINVKAGLQAISLPSVFGNPVFDDDAAALVVSAPINDMFGVAVGYTRGVDKEDNYDDAYFTNGTARNYAGKDDVDMVFLAAPVTLDGFSVTPYFGYAWIGQNTSYTYDSTDDSTVWFLGANAALTMFDPLTFAADLIYGEGDNDAYETKGWYTALAASYKMDMMTATLFGTYATGADDDADEDSFLPSLSEGFELSPYIGGARAFSTYASDGFAGYTWGDVGLNGLGIWTVGVKLSDISFVEKLSHDIMLLYAEGTSDKNAGKSFDEKDSAWEFYMVNKYMIYENLAAINELGYFAPDFKDNEDDASYFATIGFSYKF